MCALVYNKEIFNKFRAKAITNADDLEVGKTYYTNCSMKQFTFVEIVTDYGRYRVTPKGPMPKNILKLFDNIELRWAKILPIEGHSGDYIAFESHNIGVSYNPWLIFTDVSVRDQCIEELNVFYND